MMSMQSSRHVRAVLGAARYLPAPVAAAAARAPGPGATAAMAGAAAGCGEGLGEVGPGETGLGEGEGEGLDWPSAAANMEALLSLTSKGRFWACTTGQVSCMRLRLLPLARPSGVHRQELARMDIAERTVTASGHHHHACDPNMPA